jgi:acetoin utilization deacetylase AcuC-like enzyme
MATSPTAAYVYDPGFQAHDLPEHPENAGRLRHTMSLLARHGVLEALEHVPARPATCMEVAAVHQSNVLDRIRRVAAAGGGNLDADTYVCSGSLDAALLAAGGSIEAVAAVLSGCVERVFCLLRPPGHHATPTRSMGFCLLNNVALAARAAIAHPDVERVLIVDFDVHHGNGTQDAFADDPHVFYASTHQYPHYPGTGHWREIGHGAGTGTVLNVPLPPGVGDAGYAQIWDELLWPWASAARPDLVLVSAGYDAHWTDPLAQMALSLSGYAWLQQDLARMADDYCGGRIVYLLEGGYQLDVLAVSVLNACRTLLGDLSVVDPLGRSPWIERPVDSLVARIRERHGLT